MPQRTATPIASSYELEQYLPEWHVDAGPLSLCFTSQNLLPAKTRAFVDFVMEAFFTQRFAQFLSVGKHAASQPITTGIEPQRVRGGDAQWLTSPVTQA
jgi:hypothetical protein